MIAIVLPAACSPARGDDEAPRRTSQVYGEAQALMLKRKWAEAAIVFRSIIRRDPRSVSASADLAKALLYLGRREEAIGILGESIEKNRGAKRDWLIEQLRVVSKIFVTNASFQIYQDGVDLLNDGKIRPAREKFEQALASEPYNVEVLTRLGQTYLLDGDHDSASERLKTARQLDAYEPEIHLWLGRALEQRGEINEALAELHEGASALPRSELAARWLADALESLNQRAEAIQQLENDVKANPMHVANLIQLAQLRAATVAGQAQADDTKVLWLARKDLQNALSRTSDYVQPGVQRFEGDLSVQQIRSEKQLRDEIQSSLQKLESRIEAESNG